VHYSIRSSYLGGISPIDEAASVNTEKHIGSIGRKTIFKGRDNIQEARPAAANTRNHRHHEEIGMDICLWDGSTVTRGELILNVVPYCTQFASHEIRHLGLKAFLF